MEGCIKYFMNLLGTGELVWRGLGSDSGRKESTTENEEIRQVFKIERVMRCMEVERAPKDWKNACTVPLCNVYCRILIDILFQDN